MGVPIRLDNRIALYESYNVTRASRVCGATKLPISRSLCKKIPSRSTTLRSRGATAGFAESGEEP
jgi:hypothetical protein